MRPGQRVVMDHIGLAARSADGGLLEGVPVRYRHVRLRLGFFAQGSGESRSTDQRVATTLNPLGPHRPCSSLGGLRTGPVWLQATFWKSGSVVISHDVVHHLRLCRLISLTNLRNRRWDSEGGVHALALPLSAPYYGVPVALAMQLVSAQVPTFGARSWEWWGS